MSKYVIEIDDTDLEDGCAYCPLNYDYQGCLAFHGQRENDPMLDWDIHGCPKERPKNCPLVPLKTTTRDGKHAAYAMPCTCETADGRLFTKNKVLTYGELVERCRELEKQNHDLFGDYVDAITDSQEARARSHSLGVENKKLREEVSHMYREMQGVLDMSTDTVWVDKIGTLRDHMDAHMESMRELGIQPPDYDRRMRELGLA